MCPAVRKMGCQTEGNVATHVAISTTMPRAQTERLRRRVTKATFTFDNQERGTSRFVKTGARRGRASRYTR
jgi:hypothetical protein